MRMPAAGAALVLGEGPCWIELPYPLPSADSNASYAFVTADRKTGNSIMRRGKATTMFCNTMRCELRRRAMKILKCVCVCCYFLLIVGFSCSDPGNNTTDSPNLALGCVHTGMPRCGSRRRLPAWRTAPSRLASTHGHASCCATASPTLSGP